MTQLNRRITLAAYPQGLPQERDFALVEEPLAEPGPGQMLCRTLALIMFLGLGHRAQFLIPITADSLPSPSTW